MARSLIVAHIVTFNSEGTLLPCLDSLLAQELPQGVELQVYVTDNNSRDQSAQLASARIDENHVIRNEENLGFSAAHNQGISNAYYQGADYVLVLNPDVRLEPEAIKELYLAGEKHPEAGMFTPLLFRANESLNPVTPRRFDAAGMYITPTFRHFDRASEQLDNGEYRRREYVFGATGACVLLSRSFLEDVRIPASVRASQDEDYFEVFDDDFFAYREDAELSFRAGMFDWRVLYVPEAKGYHKREVLPENRTAQAAVLNRLGVQNRFLLQLNCANIALVPRCFFPTLFRNILVLGSVLIKERSSLSALKTVKDKLSVSLRKRAYFKKKRRAGGAAIARWFQFTPKAEPALPQQAETPSPVQCLTIGIVNYNSGPHLAQCLESVSTSLAQLTSACSFSVQVFDNASSDESIPRAKALFEGLRLVEFTDSSSNVGFAAAINQIAKNKPSDALLILNPDITLNAEALGKMLEVIESYPTVGLVAPLLVSDSEEVQIGYSLKRLPTIWSTLAELTFLHRLLPNNAATTRLQYQDDRSLHRFVAGEKSPSGPQLPSVVPIEQPAAACVLIRGTAYQELQGFDERFYPAWFEDVDFCKRLQMRGWLASVQLKARVKHFGGYSREEIGEATFYEFWFTNLTRYWDKHGNLLERALLRIGLFFGCLFRALRCVSLGQAEAAKTLLKLSVGISNKKQPVFAIEKTKRLLARVKRKARTLVQGSAAEQMHFSLPLQGVDGTSQDVVSENKDWRAYFSQQLRGNGLEFGALHRPLPTHSGMKVSYVDKLSLDDLRQHYPELNDQELTEPDLVLDSEVLEGLEENSYDFIIAAHLIEHLRSPLKALKRWCQVVKPGGLIYLIVPDKRYTFDKQRVRTSLEHHINDFYNPSTVRDFEHFVDYATHVGGKAVDEALSEATSLEERAYSIHFHVFVPEDILRLLNWFSANVHPIEILSGPATSPGSDEFHLLVKVLEQEASTHVYN